VLAAAVVATVDLLQGSQPRAVQVKHQQESTQDKMVKTKAAMVEEVVQAVEVMLAAMVEPHPVGIKVGTQDILDQV
jgi:hypothetical protein